MSTETRGYISTGVKTASYSKISVPGYSTIKYRLRPSGVSHAAMKEQLAEKEGNGGYASRQKRSAPELEVEVEPAKKKSKWEEDGGKEEEEAIQVEINPLDRDDSDSEDDRKADESKSGSDNGSDSGDDDEELAEIQRQLERIKREKAEAAQRAAEEKAAEAHREREARIASGNPLMLGQESDDGEGRVAVKRWYEETIFKHQAAGEQSYKKRFINDAVRNDFHKRFLAKYVR